MTHDPNEQLTPESPVHEAVADGNLKAKTVNAIKWSYFSMVTGIALQVVFAAILSRLLTVDQFGVVANAFLLQRFGQFIADLGVGQALVQKQTLTDDDVAAALTSSLVMGGLSTVLAWLLAPTAAEFFHKPDLVTVFRGYASIYILSGAIVVATSLLRRQLRFRPLVTAELSGYILGHGVLGLGSAYLGYGAMSLVISAVAQAVIQLTVLYASSRHSLRLTLRPEAYRHLYSFGMRATAVNFLEFISSSLDTFFLSKFYPRTALGLYSRTFNTLAMPAMNFASSLTRVLAPSFSAVQGDLPRLRRAYLTGLESLSLIIFTAAGCIAVDAPEIVAVLLGQQFKDAVPVMQIFAVYIPFAVISNLSGVLAEATAHLNAKIRIQVLYFMLLLTGFWLTHRLGGGVEWFAAMLAGGAILRSAAFAVLARQIVDCPGREVAWPYLRGLLTSLLTAGLTFAVVAPLRARGVGTVPLFLLEVVLGGLTLLAVVWFGPANEIQNMVKKTLGRLWRRSAVTG